MTEQTNPRDRITISVNRTHAERALQINLSQTDAKGNGLGYRLAGPKHYNMGTTELLSYVLDDRDAAEIRGMLNAAFPTVLTVHELRCGTTDQPETVTTYADAAAARAHGEHAFQQRFGLSDDLAWRDEGWDSRRVNRLYATDVDGEETETDWHVVQLVVPSEFTPEGGDTRG